MVSQDNTAIGTLIELSLLKSLREAIGLDVSSELIKAYAECSGRLSPETIESRLESVSDMTSAVFDYLESSGLDSAIKDIFWTAKPGTLHQYGFVDIDQKRHPADLVISFVNGQYLGISVKSTLQHAAKRLTFKNRGAGKLSEIFGVDLLEPNNKFTNNFINKYNLKTNAIDRKEQILKRTKLIEAANISRNKVLKQTRDILLDCLKRKGDISLLKNEFLDSDDQGLPYIKITSTKHGVELANSSIANSLNPSTRIKFVATGNDSIIVQANGERLFTIRCKLSSKPMCSSVVFDIRL